MNWTPNNIFDARNRTLICGYSKQGVVSVKLYDDGWALHIFGSDRAEGLDVWTACRMLNDACATNQDAARAAIAKAEGR